MNTDGFILIIVLGLSVSKCVFKKYQKRYLLIVVLLITLINVYKFWLKKVSLFFIQGL